MTLISERDHCHKTKQFEKYKVLRNKVTSAIKKSKKNFFNSAINQKKDPKYLWQNLTDVSNLGKPKNLILPEKLVKDNQSVDGRVNIINELNNHFVNISNIVEKVRFSTCHFTELKHKLDSKLKFKEFDIKYISAFEVNEIIKKLDGNKATGLDEISPKIIKHCGDYITTIIAHIINSSIENRIFPEAFKSARVKPILKTGNKDDSNNYRPMSILPTISKIFERHIAN